ncbi:probable glucan 1,3-beta-glucosidase A [Phalaenopsis equestris]|uniref:probable glucan 1,3-beta-glucosidase A n=1 Tax=Phalaenopsis equestris TaxID=78828 RepID=UPI0009E32880|nr:probable glucan 1,3-beta-glucosidase A [Phalaenopsis equestris]
MGVCVAIQNFIKLNENHWDNFVTAEDFSFLSEHGINTVRIPVGWWIVEDPDPPPPFIGGTLAALDRAFSWAQVYNIRCIIDLHAGPGSQNGMEHSASRDGSVNWSSPEFVLQSLDAIEFLSARYADNPALLGIELLNEPSAAAVPIDILISYYKSGYQKVRNYSSTAYVVVCQRIGNADPMELYEANIGDKNVVVDVHYYNLFDAYFNDLNPLQNMQFIYNSRRPQLQALNSANGPLVFVGEWVNEWNVTNASRIEYQIFGSTQLEVYRSATFGWSYWTLKSEEKHWDFEWSIKNKYLVLGNSQKNGIGNCTALVVSFWAIILAFYGSLVP